MQRRKRERRLLPFGIFAMPLVLLVAAWPSTARAQNMEDEAREMVQVMADKVISILDRCDLSSKERDDRFRDLFITHFNVDGLGRFALGRHWRKANKAQRTAYLDIFKHFVVKTYAVRLGQYAGEKFEVLSAKPDGKGVAVTSVIVTPGGPPIELKWRVRKTKASLQVVDVVIENISMALTQRQDFASVIQRRGGRIEGLVTALRDKVRQLEEQEKDNKNSCD